MPARRAVDDGHPAGVGADGASARRASAGARCRWRASRTSPIAIAPTPRSRPRPCSPSSRSRSRRAARSSRRSSGARTACARTASSAGTGSRPLEQHVPAAADRAHRAHRHRGRHRLRHRVRGRAGRLPLGLGRQPRDGGVRAGSTRSRASPSSSCSCRSPASRGTSAEIALVSYTLLILFRNILTGLREVPEDALEAARAMGLTRRQTLWRVELPLALPAIMAGIRIATVTIDQPRHRRGLHRRRRAGRADLQRHPDRLQDAVHRRRRAGRAAGAGHRRAARRRCSACSRRGRERGGLTCTDLRRASSSSATTCLHAGQDARARLRSRWRRDRGLAGHRDPARRLGSGTCTAARSWRSTRRTWAARCRASRSSRSASACSAWASSTSWSRSSSSPCRRCSPTPTSPSTGSTPTRSRRRGRWA